MHARSGHYLSALEQMQPGLQKQLLMALLQ